MTIYQSCSDICNQAKNKLDGKYGAVTLFAMFYYALSINANTLLSTFASSIADSVGRLSGLNSPTFTGILFYLLCVFFTILIGMVRAGLALYFLNLVCGGTFTYFQLFHGYQEDFRKTFCLSLIVTVIQEICMLPYQYVSHVQVTSENIMIAPLAGSYVLGALLFTITVLGISQVFYLLLDFPELSVKELLQKSNQLMKGHRMRYLCLQLRFVPMLLLGILSLGIGMFWVLPYVNTATTIFFLDLMNPQKKEA
ncbi:MAG: DUF975 family protein [Lachnospiraceae bacterium]|nr:DUF975 family protein [Lachnospiraceae bacterium]